MNVTLFRLSIGALSLVSGPAFADGPYQITFVNHAWAEVKLEVATGNNQDCNRNASEGPTALALNVGHTITTSASVVCYRRSANPDDPNSGWDTWTSISPNDQNTPMTVELN